MVGAMVGIRLPVRMLFLHHQAKSNNEWLSLLSSMITPQLCWTLYGFWYPLGEAPKVGCNVVDCDINPVSTFLVQKSCGMFPVYGRVQHEYRTGGPLPGIGERQVNAHCCPNGEVADGLLWPTSG